MLEYLLMGLLIWLLTLTTGEKFTHGTPQWQIAIFLALLWPFIIVAALVMLWQRK